MQLISYYLVYGIIWIFSRFPRRVLYGMSDLVFLLIYYVFPYRKKIVFRNLRNSFPEWDETQVKFTAKRFYHYFCDFFMESTIFTFMKEEEVLKRFRYKNPELLNELYSQGKSVILVFGHYGNWEYLATLPKFIQHLNVGVYKTLSNTYIDKMIINSRQRFGIRVVPIENIVRVLSEYHKTGVLNISFFAADQRPLMKNIQHWITLFNQDTPVILGPEKLAKKFNSAVVFFNIHRKNRGYYECDFSLITADPGNTKEYEITELFFKELENQIREEPAYWLWTHERWKHKKTDFDRIYGKRSNDK